MESRHTEYLIIGSGAGGAALARYLAKRGKEVRVIERGFRETHLGTYQDAVRYYDENKFTLIPKKSREGTILWRTLMAGGSTMVSCGNGVRCLENELRSLGVDLSQDFTEVESELQIIPTPVSLLSEGSEILLDAAGREGLTFQPMPKFIRAENCMRCGQCVLGCAHQGHWVAADWLREAIQHGALVEYNTVVDEVLIHRGRAVGVSVVRPEGIVDVFGDVVILAAGGLGTPVILLHSSIKEAGTNLFMDLQIQTYGISLHANQIHEPQMALVDFEFHKDHGFLLSPFINHARQFRLIEAGMKGFVMPTRNILGIMTLLADEPVGQVYADGSVSKPVTGQDSERILKGTQIAQRVLERAGADPSSIIYTRPAGAHPGGTAAIGAVVDEHLQTKVDNLFVCDASVLPVAPGLPPILTILALANHLGRFLTGSLV